MADITDTPPDRLSLDPRSEHFDETLLSRGVGIWFRCRRRFEREGSGVDLQPVARHGSRAVVPRAASAEPFAC